MYQTLIEKNQTGSKRVCIITKINNMNNIIHKTQVHENI